jgi:hypothetical protein
VKAIVRRREDARHNEPAAIQPTGDAVKQLKVVKVLGIVLIDINSTVRRVAYGDLLLAPLRPPKND